jgi:hypothetical protein
MSSKEQTRDNDKAGSKRLPSKPVTEDLEVAQLQPPSATVLQQATLDSTALTPHDVLQIQHTVGNSAVSRMLSVQRQTAPAPAPAVTATTLPSADELTARIARCIGIWETNRGKDDPAPTESSLDTVAGLHASMATIEQATMPYAISALKSYPSLRAKATPPLTLTELNTAEARCTAVVTLLSAVATASAAGTTPDDYIKANSAAITATGLSNDDVKTMFSAVTLKSTIDAAHTRVEAESTEAAKKTKLDAETAAVPEADRLGLGAGSLKSYIRKPANWGENRAAWQRKAVEAMPDNVGTRIGQVALADSGTALATPVIKGRVDVELAKNPVPGEEDIVKTVAQQNNPNETDYGKHVWETYDRLY